MVLAIVEGTPEEYENVKKIMNQLNLNIRKLKYVFTMDIKLMNIILGIMSASSTYPCPYCTIKNDFKMTPNVVLRTVGSIKLVF